MVILPEGGDFPSDEICVKTAKELRYSETAFIKRLGEKEFNIRYFTPAAEVELCGHATIGSFAALRYGGYIGDGEYMNHTISGDLNIGVDGEKIMTVGFMILIVVILHNLLGYFCGYLIGILFKMNTPRKKAVSIEIGMQNSGLATSLASSAFPDMSMATVPGAVFSVWHNISGAILAGIYRRINCSKKEI